MSQVLRFPYRTIEELRETERRLVADLEELRGRIAEVEGPTGRLRFPRYSCALCVAERSRGERP